MISVASKEIADVLSKLTESEGGVERTVSKGALTYMVQMHLVQEYMRLIALLGAGKRVSEELLSSENKDFVGDPIRNFLIEWNNSEQTSSVDSQQLAKDVVEAARVVNESSDGKGGRKSRQLTKGRDVLKIVTAAGDMTPVEAIIYIFCWNVLRAVDEADNDAVKLKAYFYANSRFTTTTNSVKESNPLMKVAVIDGARTVSRIESPNEFELTGSVSTLRHLGKLFSGGASIQSKLIQTYTIQKKPSQEDSSSKKKKRKKDDSNEKKNEKPGSGNKGATTDTEESNAKKQRTDSCADKTIVTQRSGNTTQYTRDGLENKEELLSRLSEAVEKVGGGVLAQSLKEKITRAVLPIIQDYVNSEHAINKLIAEDDVHATLETTFEGVDGFDVGKPYDETGFFEVIYSAWRNVKWREKNDKNKINLKRKLNSAEHETWVKWEKDLDDEDLRTAIDQIKQDMKRSIVFVTRKGEKLVTEEYKVTEGDVDPYKTIYIYGEPTEDGSRYTTKNTAYKWMVPKN